MIKERNPIVVIILMMITFGIYALFWYYWTKNELNELGADTCNLQPNWSLHDPKCIK
ncbi:MAG: DUF4234 domain-containing protein [Candidatus Heimdallarchaeaceae archaeon]